MRRLRTSHLGTTVPTTTTTIITDAMAITIITMIITQTIAITIRWEVP